MYLADLARRVEQTLKNIAQENPGPRHTRIASTASITAPMTCDDVSKQFGQTRFIRCIIEPSQSDVLHYNAGGLMTDKVAVCESIFEHGNNGVAVVRRLGADVFEDEGEGLQTTGADVKLRCPVVVENSRDTLEGTPGLCDDGDGDGATDTTLTFLHP
ncbi:hypothetical protein M405DRAFT_861349 [Rhizopogon salebrosus TDB-379]|nr:hypothetical protein M405DRAFT_861349 [Rhizopogon salebrosus TDB-379]